MREAGGALIVKAGCDAASIAVVDVYWTASGEQKRACKVIAAKEFAEEALAATFVRRWQAFVQESMEVPLAPLRAPLSSKRVRFESAGQVGSFLCDLLKAALRSEGSQVQLVILHAAALMGRADYAAGQFTLANLYAELAIDTPVVVTKVSGDALRRAVSQTRLEQRASQRPSRNLLHHDSSACFVDDTGGPGSIDRAPLLPDATYSVALPRLLLDTGLLTLPAGTEGRIPPLLSFFAAARLPLPEEEACMLAKQLVVRLCMRRAWLALLRSCSRSLNDGARALSLPPRHRPTISSRPARHSPPPLHRHLGRRWRRPPLAPRSGEGAWACSRTYRHRCQWLFGARGTPGSVRGQSEQGAGATHDSDP